MAEAVVTAEADSTKIRWAKKTEETRRRRASQG